jgi:hypothetical protein
VGSGHSIGVYDTAWPCWHVDDGGCAADNADVKDDRDAAGDLDVNGDGPGDVDVNGGDGPGDVDVNGGDGPGDVDVNDDDGPGDVDVNDDDGPGDVDVNDDDGPGDVDVNDDDGPGDVDVNDGPGDVDVNDDDGPGAVDVNDDSPGDVDVKSFVEELIVRSTGSNVSAVGTATVTCSTARPGWLSRASVALELGGAGGTGFAVGLRVPDGSSIPAGLSGPGCIGVMCSTARPGWLSRASVALELGGAGGTGFAVGLRVPDGSSIPAGLSGPGCIGVMCLVTCCSSVRSACVG